jgi:hypothetical protein
MDQLDVPILLFSQKAPRVGQDILSLIFCGRLEEPSGRLFNIAPSNLQKELIFKVQSLTVPELV